jgi:hypothetical protein
MLRNVGMKWQTLSIRIDHNTTFSYERIKNKLLTILFNGVNVKIKAAQAH